MAAKVEGVAELKKRLHDIGIGAEREISKAAFAGGKMIEGEAKALILRGTKTGKTYKISGTGVVYTASAPGEAPANRTGRLASSINTIQQQGGEVTVGIHEGVGDATKYARRLEYGFLGVDTAGRSYAMQPRPFLYPALRTQQKNINLLFEKAISAAMRRSNV